MLVICSLANDPRCPVQVEACAHKVPHQHEEACYAPQCRSAPHPGYCDCVPVVPADSEKLVSPKALWRVNGYMAQVHILREHPNSEDIVRVQGSFGECWAPAEEIYPLNWTEWKPGDK